MSHYLYRVTLENGEVWAVDTTGAQIGYADPLCPWHDFEQKRSSKIIKECELGYVRNQVCQSYGSHSIRQMVALDIEREELAKAIEDMIPVWARDCGGNLHAILRGSDSAFEEAKNRFLDKLEDHVKAAMAKLYTPERTARRNKRVESQVSQVMADPNHHKHVERFARLAASVIDPIARGGGRD